MHYILICCVDGLNRLNGNQIHKLSNIITLHIMIAVVDFLAAEVDWQTQ
jgi:hypothetical protein